MKYLIGLDGGGTKTTCVLAKDTLETVYECTGGSSAFLISGTETVAETILNLITECKEKAEINYNQIAAVVLGSTGAGRILDAKKLEEAILTLAQKKNIPLKEIFICSDALIALEGAFSGRPGGILIAGTGSIMYGKDSKGKFFQVGGFGRFIGDEGSGYVIGKKGVTAVARSFDGRGPNTLLTNLLQVMVPIQTMQDIVTQVYTNKFDLASFAPQVIQAAEQGDTVAVNILKEEVAELILHIKAMKKKLLTQKMEVALIGGILSSDNAFSKMFRQQVKEFHPEITLKDPENPPAYGALLMAKRNSQMQSIQ